jgi:hypothetical protein
MSTAELAVLIVYFGELPPWLPITIDSMSANLGVDFSLITDADPPPELPQNVRFVHSSFGAMQQRLSELTERRVAVWFCSQLPVCHALRS